MQPEIGCIYFIKPSLNIGVFLVNSKNICYNNKKEILEKNMAVCYKKLWKLLIDKDMKKEDLRKATGITTTAMAKLGRNENVNTEILVKICEALNCDLNDIVEIVKTEEE